MTDSELIPLDQHHRLTAGPAPWTDTRVPAKAFHAARAAFGTESWEDDQRVYRTMQAALMTLAPAEPVAWKVYHPKNPRCSYIGDLPTEFRLDTGEPDEYFGGKAVPLYAGAAPVAQPLPPVEGDILPAIGSKVLIHLASQDAWVERTVAGYYVWPNHGLAPRVFRVFVRVRDADGYLNARSLEDIRHPETASQAPAAA